MNPQKRGRQGREDRERIEEEKLTTIPRPPIHNPKTPLRRGDLNLGNSRIRVKRKGIWTLTARGFRTYCMYRFKIDTVSS